MLKQLKNSFQTTIKQHGMLSAWLQVLKVLEPFSYYVFNVSRGKMTSFNDPHWKFSCDSFRTIITGSWPWLLTQGNRSYIMSNTETKSQWRMMTTAQLMEKYIFISWCLLDILKQLSVNYKLNTVLHNGTLLWCSATQITACALISISVSLSDVQRLNELRGKLLLKNKAAA